MLKSEGLNECCHACEALWEVYAEMKPMLEENLEKVKEQNAILRKQKTLQK
jgi:hypothetical protein